MIDESPSLDKVNSYQSNNLATDLKLQMDSSERDQNSFINYSQNYCVGFVDIVDSTIEIPRFQIP